MPGVVLAAAAAAWLAPLDPAALAAMAVVTLPPVLRSAMARIGGSPRLSEALRASSDPVALCRVSGYVIEMNPAFERVAGHVATMEAALAGFVECDTGTIYRLSRSAVRVGFALEQVKEIAGGARWYLSVVRTGDGWLTWRVLSAASLGGVRLPVPDDPLESASFVHLRLSAEGAVRGNRRCRELFGPDPEALVAQLRFADGTLSLGERVLVCADGTERGFRIVAPARRDGAAGLSDDRELFLFDVTEAAVSAWSAEGSELADLPVAVMHLGRDGRIDWLNTAALRLLGERAMPGRMLAEFLTARGRRLEALIELAQASATNQSETVFSTGGEKSGRPLQLTLAPGSRFGSNRLFGVLSDATELHALQDKYAQSQKMEAVGQLAGGVAHDFNNLITAINGHCDLLLIGKDATQPEYPDLMQIRQNANRAAALVRQLLAFSRKQTLNPETLSISDVISDTLYLLDRLIGDRVKLRLDPDPGGPVGQVRADHRQLEQALMNLVVNARDAMPAGGTVTISTRRRLFRVDETRRQGVIPAGDYVELAVADEGTGLNDVMIDKVFDPFFTTKAQGEGTGLGLSTVYGIVKQSGGMVFAENRPEGGACFRMLLPRVEVVAEQVTPERTRPAATMDLTGHGSVLLVEDEAAVRSFAARALKLRGYDVVIAEEAEEALQILEDGDRRFDLIVSDVMMPGMDGPSFVAKAREMRPNVRVLFVSGYAEEAFHKQIDRPEYAFLAKPFSLTELTAKVKEVLAREPAA